MKEMLELEQTSIGLEPLDTAHRLLLGDLLRLSEGDECQVIAAFPCVICAVEHVFRYEEALMDYCDEKAFQTHIEQHARVLGVLHQVAPSVMRGDAWVGRYTIMLLYEWLLLHIASADTGIVAALRIQELELRSSADSLPH